MHLFVKQGAKDFERVVRKCIYSLIIYSFSMYFKFVFELANKCVMFQQYAGLVFHLKEGKAIFIL